MGPLVRIGARYGIGFLAAKGVIPDGLADMITDDAEAIGVVETGFALGCAFVVEFFYGKAKRLGWRL